MMFNQCRRMGIINPFSTKHINVKNLFYDVSCLPKRMGMKQALEYLKFKLEGTHHRGVDDAYNTAKILEWCLNVEGKNS